MSIHIAAEQKIAAAIMERKGQADTVFANVEFAQALPLSCRGFVAIDIDEELGLSSEQIVQMAKSITAEIQALFPEDAFVQRVCNSGNIIVVPRESLKTIQARALGMMRQRAA